jgi:hypothetical protein
MRKLVEWEIYISIGPFTYVCPIFCITIPSVCPTDIPDPLPLSVETDSLNIVRFQVNITQNMLLQNNKETLYARTRTGFYNYKRHECTYGTWIIQWRSEDVWQLPPTARYYSNYILCKQKETQTYIRLAFIRKMLLSWLHLDSIKLKELFFLVFHENGDSTAYHQKENPSKANQFYVLCYMQYLAMILGFASMF